MATPTTTTTNARHGQEQHTLLPMRQEPFFPLASQKELYTEMDRCAALLRIETQELASLSEAQSTAVTHNAQELYVAMVQLANHLHQVTHDLHHHHQRYC
ncbi:uncharacterized protein ACA1_166550, partial [Acanthamoeba castellanii str. Neff]